MKEVCSEVMAERQLLGIDVLEFAFFPSKDVPAGSGRIEVRASSCGFAEPVRERLLVAMYAWDGNAYPGNEWWAESGSGKYLTMSDDSTAASCSLITSLQHPAVNVERLSWDVVRFMMGGVDEDRLFPAWGSPRRAPLGGSAPDQERRFGRCEWLIGHIIAVCSRFVRVPLGGICNAREGRHHLR